MAKQHLAALVAISICVSLPAWAHHGHEHQESPRPPVQRPPVVVEPTVVTPMAAGLSLPAFELPPLLPISTIVQTDVAGIHSGADASKFIQIQSAPLTKEDLTAQTAPDPRYQFVGSWIPFSSDYSAHISDAGHYRTVAFLTKDDTRHYGRIEHIEKHPPKMTGPAFMPTRQSGYSKINDEHLSLRSGAVLVRAGDYPVFVSTTAKGERIMTRIAGGALAMISTFDDKTTVLNLTDRCCGALVMYLPSSDKVKQHALSMTPGQIAEVYAPDDKPTSNLLATKIDVNKRIGENYGLLVSQCHYVRTLKRFNLRRALNKPEMDRVLKTAAAVAYARR